MTIIMGQAFVIDESDFPINQGTHEFFVMSLGFFGMGEEEVGFTRNQAFNLRFFNPKKNITIL
jgi:hypothetical protein